MEQFSTSWTKDAAEGGGGSSNDGSASAPGSSAAPATTGAESSQLGGLPFDLSSLGSLPLTSQPVASTGLGLDFNIDALNLQNLQSLSSIEFDETMANLLSQVSGSIAAVSKSAVPVSTSSGNPLSSPAPTATVVASGESADGAKVAESPQVSAAGVVGSPAAAGSRPPDGGLQPVVRGPPPTAVRPANPPVSPAQRPAVRPPARPLAPGQTPAVSTAPKPRPAVRPATSPPTAPAPQMRPAAVRPAAQAAAVRPRPGMAVRSPMRPATSPTNPAALRPGARPIQRPRPPMMRPVQAGAPAPVRSPTPARPMPRPNMRPVVRPGGPPAGVRSPIANAPQTLSPGPPSSVVRPAASPRPAGGAPRPVAQTVRAAVAGSVTIAKPAVDPAAAGPSAVVKAEDKTEKEDVEMAEPAAETSDKQATEEAEGEEEEEQFLTESVEVVCPELMAPPKGFEPLTGLEGAFRSLCHGVAPTNAEWSSLNIVAVAWPQLEVAAAASRRLAQRDVADVSSMTASDSMRAVEQRRPPSSAIHLYRLHVHPPPAWDVTPQHTAIRPSLLPLCDLRMRQQWDEQVSQANMDRLVDPVVQPGGAKPQWPCNTVNVSALSGWHSGAGSVGVGEKMRVASAPRCAWSADCRMLAAGDRAGRFEIFVVEAELNSWKSVYHVDFDHPVIACLWLSDHRKYGISRKTAATKTTASTTDLASMSSHQVPVSSAGGAATESKWDVDSDIYVRRLPFFGPRNTQGEYALVVLTADGQLVLVYQRDEKWTRVVAPLQPRRRDQWARGEEQKVRGDPWSNIPQGLITHADMMLVSKKWIYLAVHRAGAAPVQYPHEPGAVDEELKQDGRLVAPTVEVYQVQIEFVSDYSPRLFATPLVVQPITLAGSHDEEKGEGEGERPRVTHLKLITALNPEVRLVEKNILGEEYYFPLLFVTQSCMAAHSGEATHDSFTTHMQVWRLEGARHTHKSLTDRLNRPPPLRLAHVWTEVRRGLLLSVIANRAERQQLRYLFAAPNDKDYRALMLTWGNGRVEMLRNYKAGADGAERFDQCVAPVPKPREWVVGGVLSPHYTAYFQLAVRPRVVELGRGKPGAAVECAWNQGHVRFRLGWTPFFSEHRAGNGAVASHVHAYCGDLLAVRVLNKEDPTDLIAILANMAASEENQPVPATPRKRSREDGDKEETAEDEDDPLTIPMSRTLAQALCRACSLLASALGIVRLELDPQLATTPFVRRLLGAIMQIHFLAQHGIQAASLGLVLHIASVVDARVTSLHDHVIQSHAALNGPPSHAALDAFSASWRRSFQPTAALAFWCIDLFAALVRDTYLYLHVRCADNTGALRRLSELDAARGSVGRIPNRVALLFHRPTLDAMRTLMLFVRQLRADLVWRVGVISGLPPNAANMPAYQGILQAKDMVVATARQLVHALEYLPMGMDEMALFLGEVQDMYADDAECLSVESQTVLLTSSTIAEPARKYLPRVAAAFAQFILGGGDEPSSHKRKLAVPNALVLHDTRWMSIVTCRATIPGLSDNTSVFETPWRVRLPVSVAGPADALVPAAELAAWEQEKSEFERALDEDNVLFDIDDPGFIFYDPSEAPAEPLAVPGAPVRITTRVPDFSDVASRDAPSALAELAIESNYTMPLFADSAASVYADLATLDSAPTPRSSRTRASSVATHSPAMTPRTGSLSIASEPVMRRSGGRVQHFVPHYSSTAPEERSSGWQFVSTPRDPTLHIPTLLAQHAFSLASQTVDEPFAYCIDWSRSEGMVVEVASTPGLAGQIAAEMGLENDRPVHSGVLRQNALPQATGADQVDVVQKTLLPANAPVKMCLRCGHITRRVHEDDLPEPVAPLAAAVMGLHPHGAALSDNAKPGQAEVGWIRRFDILCVCGGSWIAL